MFTVKKKSINTYYTIACLRIHLYFTAANQQCCTNCQASGPSKMVLYGIVMCIHYNIHVIQNRIS